MSRMWRMMMLMFKRKKETLLSSDVGVLLNFRKVGND
jgi:hypothetical protein